MAPHIPFTQLEEVQQAMNPVTGMPIVEPVLTKGNKAFNCTLSRGVVIRFVQSDIFNITELS